MTAPYRLLFDHVLSRTDPERAHHTSFRAIRAAGPLLAAGRPSRRPPSGRVGVDGADGAVEALGLTFANVLGLAAGFDKNAVGIDALAALGFGHIEIGTVTGDAQPGNPKPRLFRLPQDRAVINRMGFNNDGAEVVAHRLAERQQRMSAPTRHGFPRHSRRLRTVLGVNVGKTKVVPDDDQAAVLADYEKSARLLSPYADYLVVNVSSPNTPGLRKLQAVERLQPLLEHVRRTADDVAPHRVPMLVKIAPDLSDDDVLAVADLASAIGLDGIIATNTTLSRDGLRTESTRVEDIGDGGLSGQPLTQRALDVLRLLRGRVPADMTLIGVGGIATVADACARLEAGADLVQGYTAFIYEGPLWPRRIIAGTTA